MVRGLLAAVAAIERRRVVPTPDALCLARRLQRGVFGAASALCAVQSRTRSKPCLLATWAERRRCWDAPGRETARRCAPPRRGVHACSRSSPRQSAGPDGASLTVSLRCCRAWTTTALDTGGGELFLAPELLKCIQPTGAMAGSLVDMDATEVTARHQGHQRDAAVLHSPVAFSGALVGPTAGPPHVYICTTPD